MSPFFCLISVLSTPLLRLRAFAILGSLLVQTEQEATDHRADETYEY